MLKLDKKKTGKKKHGFLYTEVAILSGRLHSESSQKENTYLLITEIHNFEQT